MRQFNDWSQFPALERQALEGFEIFFVDKDEDVFDGLRYIESDRLGCDTETTELDPTVKDARLRLVQIYCSESDRCIVFDIFKLSQEMKEEIALFLEDETKLKIFHNAKFDLKWLRVHLNCQIINRVYCTMLAHQLVCCGSEYERHNLAHVVEKYLNIRIDKAEQRSDWTKEQLSDEQIVYGALDTRYLPPIAKRLTQELKDQRQLEVAKIEFDAVSAFAEIEITGFLLNIKRWLTNISRQHHRMIRLEGKISNMLNPMNTLFPVSTFKVSSPTQLKLRLKEAGVEIPLVKDKKTGILKESTGIDHLEKIKDKHPSIPLLIKYGSIKQYHNAFGMKYLRWVNDADGRLHPNIKQIGPLTGRSSFYEPNLQQVPQLSQYRGCFISAPGRKLIISDYSQVELRILAHQSQDVNMMRAFNEGHDLHKFTASLVFNVDLSKVTPVQRRRAKDLNFGIVFGIGPDKFAASSGLTRAEGEKLMGNYFRAYSGLKDYLAICGRQGRFEHQSRTASNRLVKYEVKEGDHIAASKAERNGKNTPAQGTSADITKLALGNLIRAFKKAKIDAALCHVVHDEIISDVVDHDIEVAKEIQERVMIEAGEVYITSIPVKLDTHVSDRWKK
jgi:DNA polymerase I-like protein with 3'-5' exonuclease and polymerase domains